ncbi:MAG: hypothetical protein ACREHC_01895 [Candidatus Levyibacteriota bacterium]
MKRVLLFISLFIIGFVFAIAFMHIHQQQTTQKIAERAKTSAFSLERAPTDSLQGKIATLSGTVNWQSRVATQPAQIKKPRIIQQGEELRTGKDGTVSVQMHDGPLLTLLPNSHVNFIQTLPSSMVITQDQGTVTYRTSGKAVSIESLSLLTILHDGMMTVSVDQTVDTARIDVTNGNTTEAFNDSNNLSNVIPVTSGHAFLFSDDTLTGSVE